MEIMKKFESNDMNMHITIKGTHDEPLFRASDIGSVMGISQINSTMRDFDSSQKVMQIMHTPGGSQEVVFLTEQGLYEILFRSHKPIAKQFKKLVCEVLKEIRLNGKYELQQQIKDTIKSKEQNLIANFGDKPINYVGLTEDNIIKTGYTDNVLNRLNDHKREIRSDFTFEYVYESVYNREIERRLYQNPEMKKRRFSKVYPGRKEAQTELFQLDSDFTIDEVDKIIKKIKKEVETEESNKAKDAEINKLKLIIYEFENNKLKDEIESLKKQTVEIVQEPPEVPLLNIIAEPTMSKSLIETPKVSEVSKAPIVLTKTPEAPKEAPKVSEAPIEVVNKRKTKKCLDCDKIIWNEHTRCNGCSSMVKNVKNRKVENRPTIEEINEFLKTMTMTDIAVKYGVSSNAIKKWIKLEEKRNGLETIVQRKCLDCNCDIFKKSPRCQSCCVKLANLKEPVIKPSLDTIQELLKTMTYVDIATKYKVSDTTIRKWIKVYKQS